MSRAPRDRRWTDLTSEIFVPLLVAWKCIEHFHTVDYLSHLHPHHFVISMWHFVESPGGHTLLLMAILACLAVSMVRPGK